MRLIIIGAFVSLAACQQESSMHASTVSPSEAPSQVVKAAVASTSVPKETPTSPPVEAKPVVVEPATPSLEVMTASFLAAFESKDYRRASDILDTLNGDFSKVPAQDPKVLSQLETLAKTAERKKDWQGAIDARKIIAASGGASQEEKISGLKKRRDIEIEEVTLKKATKEENWDQVIAALERLEALTGKSKAKELKRAATKKEEAIARLEHEAKVAQMQRGVSSGGVRFSVQKGQYKKCLSYQCGSGDSRFLMLHATIHNDSRKPVSVNPHHVTLSACGHETSHDISTYSLNHFEAVKVHPGNYSGGWISFLVNKNCKDLKLRYESWGQDMMYVNVVGDLNPQ